MKEFNRFEFNELIKINQVLNREHSEVFNNTDFIKSPITIKFISIELMNFLIDSWKIKWQRNNLVNILDFISNELHDINSIYWLLKIINISSKENYRWKFKINDCNDIIKWLHETIKNKINNKDSFSWNLEQLIFTILNLIYKLDKNDNNTKWILHHSKKILSLLIKQNKQWI